MNCFVTGATGFIGSRLVEKLAEEGHEVYCLIRSPKKFPTLNRENIHPIYGDLDNPEALSEGCKACEVVFHLAAYAKPWSKEENLPFQINVQGTINILEAALKAHVEKFIFTSSAAVLGPSTDHQLVDENIVRQTPFFNEYEATKALAEEKCLGFLRKGLPVVIVNPTRVFGPGPINESNSTTKIINLYNKGVWHILPGDGSIIGNYVYIDDIIEGHLLAVENGKPGEKYILGGENLSFSHFFNCLHQITGKKRFLIHLSLRSMLFIAKIMELQSKITGLPPLITPKWVNKYLHNWNLSSQKAIDQLGYKITPFKEGVEQTVNWLNHKI